MTNGAAHLRLMAVLAHPDDESLGFGGTLARYAAEGIETALVTATRGERGWTGDPAENPGLRELGRIREGELRAAAETLGIGDLSLLDYLDGDLDQADPAEAIAKIAGHLRRFRPQVVMTFDPQGAYGHPDHIAIFQLTAAAIAQAASATAAHGDGQEPHTVSKWYFLVQPASVFEAYQAAFGDLVMHVDGATRRASPYAEWMITTRLDTLAYWEQVWAAIACHRTQLPNYAALRAMPESSHAALWGEQTFYRAFSLVNGGRRIERDLFEGLRGPRTDATPNAAPTADATAAGMGGPS
jgi:LmbE family N-acetylglucosaminyl deacetylase